VIDLATEIERKYLVRDAEFLEDLEGEALTQAYLASGNGVTVRVRIASENAWLTVKGPTHGLSRLEFEYSIPLDDARALLALAPNAPIEKTRFRIPEGDVVWEVDVFEGANAGLVTAEVELEREDQTFSLPPWIEREVSDEPRYGNASLSIHPYGQWSPER
jgi:CYTH domain-containing protein